MCSYSLTMHTLLSPLPFLNLSRVVEACAIMLPPIGLLVSFAKLIPCGRKEEGEKKEEGKEKMRRERIRKESKGKKGQQKKIEIHTNKKREEKEGNKVTNFERRSRERADEHARLCEFAREYTCNHAHEHYIVHTDSERTARVSYNLICENNSDPELFCEPCKLPQELPQLHLTVTTSSRRGDVRRIMDEKQRRRVRIGYQYHGSHHLDINFHSFPPSLLPPYIPPYLTMQFTITQHHITL